jgi:hypothetical protein
MSFHSLGPSFEFHARGDVLTANPLGYGSESLFVGVLQARV